MILGDYSPLSKRLDLLLVGIAKGEKFKNPDDSVKLDLLLLEEEEMIKIESYNYRNGTVGDISLTSKGREMLNRGGYADFNPKWQPNLFDEY